MAKTFLRLWWYPSSSFEKSNPAAQWMDCTGPVPTFEMLAYFLFLENAFGAISSSMIALLLLSSGLLTLRIWWILL